MKRILFSLLFAFLVISELNAQNIRALTPGNFVVLQQNNLSGTPGLINFREYTPAGNLVQSKDLSTLTSPNNPLYLTSVGTGETELGFMSRSGNGQYATFGAYGQASTTGNRIGALVKYDGTINSATTFTGSSYQFLTSSPATTNSTSLTLSSNPNFSASQAGAASNATTGTTTLTLSGANANFINGNYVYGPGIPANTTIVNGGGTAALTLSNTTIGTNSGSTYYTSTSLYKISGTGIPSNTTITGYITTTRVATLSQAATVANSAVLTVELTSPTSNFPPKSVVTSDGTGLWMSYSGLSGTANGILYQALNGTGTPTSILASATGNSFRQMNISGYDNNLYTSRAGQVYNYFSGTPTTTQTSANNPPNATSGNSRAASKGFCFVQPISGVGEVMYQAVAATASAAAATNGVTSGSSTVTLGAANATFAVGNFISGPGIPNGTTITANNGSGVLTISQSATSSQSAQTYYTSLPSIGGIYKYYRTTTGSAWTPAGSFGTSANNYLSVTAQPKPGGGFTLYAVKYSFAGNSTNITPTVDGLPRIVKIDDAAAYNATMNATESVIVTGSAARDVFRGISAAPTVAANLAVYYYKGTGNVDDVNSWTDNYDGSAGTSPANFTADNQVFILKNAATINSFSGSSWIVSGTNSTIYVGDGFNAVSFVASNKTVTINGTGISTSNVNFGSSLTTGFSAFYYKGTGNLESLASWGSLSDGTGVAPSDFTSNGITYTIKNASSATIGANWVVSGTSSKVVVGDGTNATSFIIPSAFTYTGTVDVSANATLTTQNSSTVLPTIGTLSAGSTISFSGSTSQSIPVLTTYQNVIVNNSAGAILGGNITVLGNLTLQSGTLADRGFTLTLRGNILGSGTHTSGGFKMSGISFSAGATSIVLPSAPSYLTVNLPIYAPGFDKQTRVTAYDPVTRTISFTPATLSAGTNVTVFNIPNGNGNITALGAYTWTSGNTVTLSSTPSTSTGIVIGYPITAASGIPAGTVVTGYNGSTTLTLSQTPTASGTFTSQAVGRIVAQNATAANATNLTLGDASGTLTLGNITVGNSSASSGATTVTLGNTVDLNGQLIFQVNSTTTTTSTTNYIDLNEKTLNCHSVISPNVSNSWILLGGSNSSTTSSFNLYSARIANGGALTLRLDATKKYLNSFITTGYSSVNSTSPLTIASDVIVKNFTLGAAGVVVNTGIAATPASVTILNTFSRLLPVNNGQIVAGGSNLIRFSNTAALTLPSTNPFGSGFSLAASTTLGSTTMTLQTPNLNIQAGMGIGNSSLSTIPLENGTTVAAYDGNLTITLSKAAIASSTNQTQFFSSPFSTANNSISICDIVINGGGAVNLGCNVGFGGSITLSNNSSLGVGANTLGLYTDVLSIASGSTLTANSSSSLVFGGTAANLSIPSNITALNNLTINNTNGVTMNSNISLAGTLTLLNGNLKNTVSNNITLANATSVNLSGGGFLVAPVFGTTVNLEYRANAQAVAIDNAPDPVAYTTGKEIPTSTSVLNNVSFNAYSLSGITVTNAGEGYTNAPSISIGSGWAASTAYTVGTQVTNGGNLYTCTQAGTSATANGPLDYGNSLTDGTVKWDYVGVAPQAYCKLNGSGGISVVMTMNGSGYTSAPTITITGVSGNNAGVTTTATATAVLTSPTITLGSNATINGVLSLTNGKLLLSFFNLTIGSSAGAITGANSNSYILTDTTGKLIRTNVPLNTATAFPMGIVGYYTPLTITNTAGNGSTMSVGARRYFNYSVGDSTQALFLQWSVLGTVATTSNITYQFNTGNQAPDFVVTSACELGTYKTSYVVKQVGIPTSLGGGVYTLSTTGLTVPTSGENFYVIGNTGNIVVTATTWTGGTGTTNWNSFDNWDNGVPSGSSVDVTIPNTSIKPTLTTTQSVKSLTLASGAILTITSPGSLLVTRDLTNNGTITGTGLVTMNGTSLQTIYGTGTTATNFTVNNTGGVTVASGNNKLNLSGLLSLKLGLLTTNGNVVLKSTSIVNSATVASVGTGGNTGTISGTVQVERFIPKGYRAWRDIAPGVFNAGSIYNNWQETGSYANTGYGVFITGTTSATNAHAVDATTGLDQTVNSLKSAYTFTGGNWNAVTNTKNTNLNPFLGYRVLVRGDRTFNLYTTPISTVGTTGFLLMVNPTAIRAKGNLVTGNVVYATSGITNAVAGSTYNNASFGLNNTSATGFSSVANPYVAPIDWKNIWDNNRAVNLTATYYYLDPTIGSTGAYVSYNAISDVTSNSLSGTRRYIQAGQGFFVQNTTTSPSLTITESDKAISSTKTTVFGNANRSRLAINLMRAESGDWKQMDGATIVFDQQFSNKLGREDAVKMINSGENIAINSNGQTLSIEGRLPASTTDSINLKLNQMNGSYDYQLQVDATNYTTDGVAAYLYDAFKNTTTLLTSGVNSINFSIDASKASYENRFGVVFKPTAPLGVKSITATAALKGETATISWKAIGEEKVAKYEVERSGDSHTFTKIGEAISAQNLEASNYTATDNNVNGNSYYRIKATNFDGSVQYSNVARLEWSVVNAQLSIAPNPVKATLNIKLSNVTSGSYTLKITNAEGKQVVNNKASISNGIVYSLQVSNLASGVYTVELTNTNGEKWVEQMVKQ